MKETAETAPVPVWDLPVRLCHWSFVVIIPAMWWTAENSEMWWHQRLGMVLLTLLVFRILWGFVGSSTARFSDFVRGPGAILAYLRGNRDKAHLGHNPLGALSVLALLAAMIAQVSMGLFAGDPFDGATGPLRELVGVMTADRLTDWHHAFVWGIAALIALHLAAITFYAVFKQNDLVSPMLSGVKEAPAQAEPMNPAPVWRALLCLAFAAGLAAWIWVGAPPLSAGSAA